MNKNTDVVAGVLLNVIITITCAIAILWPLTYTQVPVESIHQWYGRDLHTYLIYLHTVTTFLWVLGEGVVNILWFVMNKKGK